MPHTDHTPDLGVANGIATLGGDGLLALAQRPPGGGQTLYDAIVAPSGGDYTLPSAAFAAGKKRVWMRSATYAETANVVIPDEGMLVSEVGAVIDFAGGAFNVSADGNGGTTRTTGTFSVTAGSTAVVGVSTLFQTWWGTGAPASPTFLFIGPDAYQIASVTDETNLVLTKAWQGPNRSGLGMFGTVMCSDVKLDSFSIKNSTHADGGLFIRAARKFLLHDVVVEGCTHNIHFADCANGQFDGVTSSAGGDHCAEINSSRSLMFSECHFRGAAAGNGAVVTGGLAHKFDDCEFSVNQGAGVLVTGSATDISFNGCGSKQNLGNGITLATSTVRCIVSGCTLAFNGGSGLANDCSQSVVVGNVITHNAVDGVVLTVADDVIVAANRIQNNAGYGVSVPGTSVNRLRLLANSVTLNTTANYRVLGGAGGDTTIFSGEYAGSGITGPVRHNSGGLVPPTQSDDATQGYQKGSIWVDTVLKNCYVCLDNATAAAIWNQVDVPARSLSLGRQTPGENFYGGLLDYPASGGSTSGEIQYVRLWFTAGTVITSGRCFVDTGGSDAPARSVRFGIYSQTSPTSTTGLPVTLVASTAASTTGPDNGSYKTVAFSSPYTVPTTGYYWIAFVVDSGTVKLASSASFRASYLPVRRESGSGTNLPATAGTLSNPVSALIYVSVVE